MIYFIASLIYTATANEDILHRPTKYIFIFNVVEFGKLRTFIFPYMGFIEEGKKEKNYPIQRMTILTIISFSSMRDSAIIIVSATSV